MDNYAVITISGNKVVNIIVWDGDTSQWGPGKGHSTVKLKPGMWCDIGAIYDKDTGIFSFPDGYVKSGSEE